MENRPISVREYAESRKITVQSVYGTIKRLSDDMMTNHTTKQGRTMYLDAVAVQEIDKLRMVKAVEVVSDQNLINEMSDEITRVKNALLELEHKNNVLQKELLDAKAEQIELATIEAKYNVLLEDHQRITEQFADEKKQMQKDFDEKQEQLRTDLEQERIKTAVAVQKSEDTEKMLDDTKTRLEATESRLEGIEKELDEARTEADSYVRSFFGFYRKK